MTITALSSQKDRDVRQTLAKEIDIHKTEETGIHRSVGEAIELTDPLPSSHPSLLVRLYVSSVIRTEVADETV